MSDVPRSEPSRTGSRVTRIAVICVLAAIAAVVIPVVRQQRLVAHLNSLEAADAPEISATIAQLESSDLQVRAAAAKGLGNIGPDAAEAIPHLIVTLGDESPFVASHAAWALGAIDKGSAEVVDALIVSLAHEDNEVRRYAAYAISQIGPNAKKAAPVLKELVSDPLMGYMAVRALGDLHHRESIPEITAFLVAATDLRRAEAADALGKLHPLPAEAVQALEGLLEDKEELVRSTARKALDAKPAELNEPVADDE